MSSFYRFAVLMEEVTESSWSLSSMRNLAARCPPSEHRLYRLEFDTPAASIGRLKLGLPADAAREGAVSNITVPRIATVYERYQSYNVEMAEADEGGLIIPHSLQAHFPANHRTKEIHLWIGLRIGSKCPKKSTIPSASTFRKRHSSTCAAGSQQLVGPQRRPSPISRRACSSR